MDKKIRAIGALILVILWGALTAFAWFSPAKERSLSERRLLAQAPELSAKAVISGKYMANFEDYATDQFPGRDFFRGIKAAVHRYGLWQQDNNDLYLAEGYLVKQDHPLQTAEVAAACKRLGWIYDNYLKDSGSRVFCAVVPDKGYYLAEDSGHLAMDYELLFDMVRKALPNATHIDLTQTLSADCYYYTDTHWRQEKLLQAAKAICDAMEVPSPTAEEFTVNAVSQPFYGVYHGQAALPLKPDTMYLMESDRLNRAQVGIHNGNQFAPVDYTGVYDMEKLSSKEPYDVFLSGTQSLIQIVNPGATTDRELIIFRDSFGSSIAPLLISDYKTVTLVDIRQLESAKLKFFLDFHGQDVLFLYSTLVLNAGNQLK